MDYKALPWPLTRLPRVFHVGTLDPSDKGCRGYSLEGSGLSVSLHPQEWTEIARLGGQPTWKLQRKGSRGFLAFHSLGGHLKSVLLKWALAQGYLRMQPVWELSWFDEDHDERVRCWYDDEARAREELEFQLETDESAALQATEQGRATAQLVARCGFDPGGLNDLDIVATVFAEDVLQLDGVWWEDRLDVCALSAPRGVICASQLTHWKRTQVRQSR